MAAPRWVGWLEETMPYYNKDMQDTLSRYRPELMLSMKKATKHFGRKYGSDEYRWYPKVSRPTTYKTEPGATIPFARNRLFREARMGFVEYRTPTALTRVDHTLADTENTIIDYVTENQSSLEDSLAHQLSVDFLGNDGHGARDLAMGISGMQSFLGMGAANADGKRRLPNDNYANLSTVYGAFGGDGEEDDNYVVWSPNIIDYTGTGWGTSPATWSDRCLEAINFGMQLTAYRNQDPGFVDMLLVESVTMWNDLLLKLFERQEFVVQQGKDTDDLTQMGFLHVQYRNCKILPSQSVLANRGYGINNGNVTWWSMSPNKGNMYDRYSDYETGSATYRWELCFTGNVIFGTPLRHFYLINQT